MREAGNTHLVHDVVERGRVVDREADEQHVRLGVAERAQPVVLLLPGRIPQRELDQL